MKRRRLPWVKAALCLVAALALGACEAPKPKVKMPARLLYLQGQSLMDQDLYSEAITKFQAVVDQNPGTLLGTYAYLQIADLHSRKGDWGKAETNYRLFLAGDQNTHLTPYVLYKLAQANHEESYTGILFPSREVDRDQSANKRIIQEYRRFFFLYPNSIFLPQVRSFARDARQTLAEHERQVGDFYFDRELYGAAASRYLYLLRNYPDYPRANQVLQRLILTYRRNQQPDLADEMERLAKSLPPEPGAQHEDGPTGPDAVHTDAAGTAETARQ